MNAAKAQQDVKRHLPNAKRRVLQQMEPALRRALISTLAMASTASMAIPVENLKTKCTYGQCVKCDLKGSNLAGYDVKNGNFAEANFATSNLDKIDFERASLTGANFTSANLHQANFERADLTGAILLGVNAQEANFERATLVNAKLDTANLQGANFERADLTGASFAGANLEGANFYWAVITPEMKTFLHSKKVKNLDKAILSTSLEKGKPQKPHHKHAPSKTPSSDAEAIAPEELIEENIEIITPPPAQ